MGPVKASLSIENAFASAAGEFNLPANAIALTGFSQGGMMSLHCGLHMQVKPGAIVSFSGALLVHKTLPKLGKPITSDLATTFIKYHLPPSPACAWHRGYGGAICADARGAVHCGRKGC